MAAGEEMVGDQVEVDVFYISFKWSHMLGCYKVDGGWLELQTQRTEQVVPHVFTMSYSVI